MGAVWINVETLQSQPWSMRVVDSAEDATLLSVGDAHRVARRASKEFPLHEWELVTTYLRDAYLVQGFSK